MSRELSANEDYLFLVNDITKMLDKHLKKEIEGFYNYIYNERFEGGIYLIRYPGATRGKVKVDENMVIEDIIIYSNTDECYEKDVRNYLNEFIGMKMVLQ